MNADSTQLPEAPFTEPWQARIFALMVDMNARGHFAWRDFQAELARRIAADEAAGIQRDYYESWLMAAEALLATKGLVAQQAHRHTHE